MLDLDIPEDSLTIWTPISSTCHCDGELVYSSKSMLKHSTLFMWLGSGYMLAFSCVRKVRLKCVKSQPLL